jgi:FkbM family methyltransferase
MKMSLQTYSLSRVLQLIPPGTRGKVRLARRLLGTAQNTKNVTVTDRFGNTFLVPSLRDPIAFYLVIDGMYEPWTTRFLLQSLKKGQVFVDVGANIGAFAILAARHVGDAGRVLAIEASAQIWPYLEYNMQINQAKNLQIEHYALLDSDGLTLPFYNAPAEHFGMGSLAPQFNESGQTVTTRCLDNVLESVHINRVDVLKVDVEGFEMLVFRGGEKLLTSQSPPLIIFEFCDWAEQRSNIGSVGDAQRLLCSWGYQIWCLQDFICERSPLSTILTTGSEMLVARKMYS